MALRLADGSIEVRKRPCTYAEKTACGGLSTITQSGIAKSQMPSLSYKPVARRD
jgi:hypothetical protein